MVGKVGKVLKEIGPEGGKIFIEGEIWQAYADETIPEGEKVVVVEKDGLILKVRRKNR